MIRLTRMTIVALTLAVLPGAACSRDNPSPPEMRAVPAEAIGVVSVGPDQAGPIVTDTDHTSVYAFDAAGTLLGQIQGGAIDLSRVLSWRRGFTTATADSVVTVTDTGRYSIPIDENIVEGAVRDTQSGRSLFWFNTGRPDGPGTAYRNNYVLTSPDGEFHTGSVPGMVFSAAHCGDRVYGVVADVESLMSDQQTIPHRLYELPVDGGEPLLRGEWAYPAGFRTTSRASVCWADGTAIYNIYGSGEARYSENGEPASELVRIDTATGAHTESPVDTSGHVAVIRPNTLTLVNDRLYWIGMADGAVLSLPLAGASEVREEWTLPAKGFGHQATVTGTTVAHLDDTGDTPEYTEYDLLTGERTRETIALPWLKSIAHSRTESGRNRYVVTGVACLPS
ncbi:MAG TPA: hypothetical protein VIW24_06840 [Aldersonia sp.]